jgi:hypothetical protein
VTVWGREQTFDHAWRHEGLQNGSADSGSRYQMGFSC